MGLLGKIFGGKRTPPPEARTMSRNAPCWCGSGKKYKHCHLENDRAHFLAIQNAACKGPT